MSEGSIVQNGTVEALPLEDEPKRARKLPPKKRHARNKSEASGVERAEVVASMSMPDLSKFMCSSNEAEQHKATDSSLPSRKRRTASNIEGRSKKQDLGGQPRDSSKRQVKPVKIYTNTTGQKCRSKKTRRNWESENKAWSPQEIRKFLGMLQQYGSRRVLHERLFKERSVEEQRRFLNAITAPARHRSRSIPTYIRKCNIIEKVFIRDKEELKAPVTQWLEKILLIGEGAASAGALAQAFHSIAEYEDHPKPEECGGIDFAAIYRYYGDLANGEVPEDPSHENAAVILEMIKRLSKRIVPYLSEGKELLNNIDEMQVWQPNWGRVPVIEEPSAEELAEAAEVRNGDPADILSSMINVAGLNPFNFDLESLKSKEGSEKTRGNTSTLA